MTERGPVVAQLARCPWSDRNPSRSDRRGPEGMGTPLLLDDLAAHIAVPFEGARIFLTPLLRRFVLKEFRQGELRSCAPNYDFSIMHLDLDTLAVAEANGFGDVAWETHRQILAPFSYCNARHEHPRQRYS